MEGFRSIYHDVQLPVSNSERILFAQKRLWAWQCLRAFEAELGRRKLNLALCVGGTFLAVANDPKYYGQLHLPQVVLRRQRWVEGGGSPAGDGAQPAAAAAGEGAAAAATGAHPPRGDGNA